MSRKDSRSAFIFKQKKKVDPLLSAGIKLDEIDYKDVALLSNFVTPRGTIIPKRVSKLRSKTQRVVAKAIKRARIAALLPFDNVKKF